MALREKNLPLLTGNGHRFGTISLIRNSVQILRRITGLLLTAFGQLTLIIPKTQGCSFFIEL